MAEILRGNEGAISAGLSDPGDNGTTDGSIALSE